MTFHSALLIIFEILVAEYFFSLLLLLQSYDFAFFVLFFFLLLSLSDFIFCISVLLSIQFISFQILGKEKATKDIILTALSHLPIYDMFKLAVSGILLGTVIG